MLGPVSLGLAAALVFRMFDEILPETLRYRMRRKGWSRRIVRVVLMQGAVFFVCSDPVWRAGQMLSPTMLLLVFTLVALRLFFRALRTSNRRHAIIMSAVLGLLAAETPFALLPMAVFPLIIILRTRSATQDVVVMANPLVRLITFRRMSLAFIGGWLLLMVSNTFFFRWQDGLEAQGWNAFTYYIHYLYRYVQLIQGAATPVGWIFIFGVVVFPVVMSAVLLRQATDDDRFLVYLHGLYFIFFGLLAVLQSVGWKPFWFWMWTGTATTVNSHYLLCLCLLITSLTAMMSLCVIGVEIYFRNYRRIARIRFQDAVEDEPVAERMVKNFRMVDHVLRGVLLYEPVVAAALVFPFKFSQTEHQMESVVNAYARQTAAECGNAKVLFTDGAVDAAVEVAILTTGTRPIPASGGRWTGSGSRRGCA